MKRFLIWMGGILVVLALILFLLAQFYLPGFLKKEIENQARNAGFPTRVEQVSVSLYPSLSVSLVNIDLESNSLPVSAKIERALLQVPIGLQLFMGKVPVRVGITKPSLKVNWKDLPQENRSQPAQAKVSSKTEDSSSLPIELSIYFRLDDGKIDFQYSGKEQELIKTLIEELNIEFEVPSLTQDFHLDLSTHLSVGTQSTKIKTPIKIESTFGLQDKKINITKSLLQLGPLPLNATGWMSEDLADLKVFANIDDLARFPLPEGFTQHGKWQGPAKVSTHIKKEAKGIVSIDGNYEIPGIWGNGLNIDLGQGKVNGRVWIKSNSSFKVLKSPTDLKYSFSPFYFDTDLTHAQISIKNQLEKPAGTNFRVNINAFGDQTASDIKLFHFGLGDFVAQAKGKVENYESPKSDINLHVPKFEISKLIPMFPAAKGTQVNGSAELSARALTNGTDIDNISVYIAPLKLTNINGSIEFKDKDINISGPISLNTNVKNLSLQGKNLKSANLSASGDLSKLKIVYQNLFNKPASVPLTLQIQAAQTGKKVQIKKGYIKSGVGNLNISGLVTTENDPSFDLKTSLSKMQFGTLFDLLPSHKEYRFNGSGEAQLAVKGKYYLNRGIEKSPIKLTGNSKLVMSSFKWRSPPETKGTGGGGGKASGTSKKAPVEDLSPFLPNWPILKTAQIKHSLVINSLDYDKLIIKGIRWAGQLKNGDLLGSGSIQNILDGKMTLKKLSVSLVKKQPLITAEASMNHINMQKGLNWSFPEWKDLVKGYATGTAYLKTRYPATDEHIVKTVSQGQLKVSNGFISSLQIDKMINDLASKIPGVSKGKSVHSKGATANIAAEYKFSNATLHLPTMHMITPEDNELQAKGQVSLDHKMNFEGILFVRNPDIKGDIKLANSDEKGRFKAPLFIGGSVFDPDIKYMKTVEILTKNLAKYQLQKQKKKIEQKAKKEVKKKAKELLKSIFK